MLPNDAWRRIALAGLLIALCVGIAQIDPTTATPRSARDRALATQVPTRAPIRPVVSSANRASLSRPLRDIVPIPLKAARQSFPIHPLPKVSQIPALLNSTADDPVVQSQPAPASLPGPIRNFEGLSNADNATLYNTIYWPPDPNGDVGANYYVQVVNRALAIWSKSGQQLLQPVPLNALWQGTGNICEQTNDGEPIILYDHLANRWLLSQVAYPNYPNGPYYQCIAISQTSDPTAGYWVYNPFKISDTKLNDYPKFGVWPDGYYLSVNQFTNATDWGGAGAVVFERPQMLQGQPAGWITFDLFSVNSSYGAMLPADLDGPPPPAGTPDYFVEVDDANFIPPNDALSLWQFHVDWNNPNNSTFGLQGQPNKVLPTAPFNLLPCAITYTPCIPQKGTTQKLDALADRLMYRLQYRNFGDHQSLVVNHTVDAGGGRAGIRWYEVRNPGGAPVIYQQGTYAPAGSEHRWMGSAAMDRQGNLALGFSVSGSSTFPSIRYAGRLVSDPPGVLAQGEQTLRAGAGSQTDTDGRWGDYTMLAVDPSDDCTFWYTNEYYSTTAATGWRTRIGSFKFPTCTGAPTGHLMGTITRATNGTPIPNATVRAGTHTTTTDSGGRFRFFNLPVGAYNLSASAPGFISKTVNGVSVSDRATTTRNVALQGSGRVVDTRVLLPLLNKPLPPPPTPTPDVPVPCGDAEPNNIPAEAKPLAAIGRSCIGTFPGDDQDDWYTVNLGAGQTIDVSLKNIPLNDDYDIYLFDPSGSIILQRSTNPGSADEHFSANIGAAGRYYVEIYARTKHAAAHSYILKVVIS